MTDLIMNLFLKPQSYCFKDKGHSKILHEGEALIEYADYYDYTSSYPEGEREDGDEEAELDAIDDDCFELVLPSGAKVGHRSLARYYKQSLNPGKNLVTVSFYFCQKY